MIQPYRCVNNHYSELITKYDARPKTILCECGKRAKRVIGLPSVRFRGDGWQTPQPHNPKPWEGSALEGMEEKSQEFTARRKEKGFDPVPREKKVTVDYGSQG